MRRPSVVLQLSACWSSNGGFAILTGRPLTHNSSCSTRVEREAGKFFGVGSLMDRICRECTSLEETVENTEEQHRLGRSDREVIVVGGSAAGLFTAARVKSPAAEPPTT